MLVPFENQRNEFEKINESCFLMYDGNVVEFLVFNSYNEYSSLQMVDQLNAICEVVECRKRSLKKRMGGKMSKFGCREAFDQKFEKIPYNHHANNTWT